MNALTSIFYQIFILFQYLFSEIYTLGSEMTAMIILMGIFRQELLKFGNQHSY